MGVKISEESGELALRQIGWLRSQGCGKRPADKTLPPSSVIILGRLAIVLWWWCGDPLVMESGAQRRRLRFESMQAGVACIHCGDRLLCVDQCSRGVEEDG